MTLLSSVTSRRHRKARSRFWLVLALLPAAFLAQVVLAAPPSANFTISDATPEVGQSVTFDASGSTDADGDVTTYEWDFEYDGSFDPAATGTSVMHSYASAGSRSVALRVTDDVTADGTVDQSVAVRSVNVSTPNQDPNASFGWVRVPPNNGNVPFVGQQLAFDAGGSGDPDGDSLSYEWSFGDGGTAAGATATHAYGSAGTKTVTLTVRDNHGGSDSTQQSVPVNALPIAQANIVNAQAEPGQRIDMPLVGQPFAFTGGPAPGGPGSSDPGGAIAAYAWDLDNNGSFETGGRDVGHPGYATPGERTVRLQVTDSNGATSVDSLTFRVNSPPIAGFIHEPLTPIVDQPVQFSSTAGDPDGDQLTYNWDLDGDGVFGELTPAERGPNPVFAFPGAGTRTVSLRVTDAGGVTRQASRQVIVQLSVPNGGFGFSPDAPVPGQSVTFLSTSTPSAGKQITGVEWDFDYDAATGTFTTDATGPAATRSFATAGSKRVAIKVSEGPSGGFDIETRTVVVNAVPNAGFTVAPDQPVAGDTVTMSSTSADPDGPLTAQDWDLDGDGQFDDATGSVVRVRFTPAGSYPVALRVRDSRGAEAAAARRVAVSARQLSVLPNVIIQIRGRIVGGTTVVSRLFVRAPARARVTVRCVVRAPGPAARGCAKARTRVSRGRRMRFRQVERSYPAGAKLVVTVKRRGNIGRRTTYTMRSGNEPRRRDLCIAPGAEQPTRCPDR